jgi:hypothetical protein
MDFYDGKEMIERFREKILLGFFQQSISLFGRKIIT